MREGDGKVRVDLEKNVYGRWEMKEEGRGPSKFPFLPPVSPRPHERGGRVNAAHLLLVNPGQDFMELPPELFSEARGISGNSLPP